jgi:hypothetical protein
VREGKNGGRNTLTRERRRLTQLRCPLAFWMTAPAPPSPSDDETARSCIREKPRMRMETAATMMRIGHTISRSANLIDVLTRGPRN